MISAKGIFPSPVRAWEGMAPLKAKKKDQMERRSIIAFAKFSDADGPFAVTILPSVITSFVHLCRPAPLHLHRGARTAKYCCLSP